MTATAKKDPSMGQQLYERWATLIHEGWRELNPKAEPEREPGDWWNGLEPYERHAWERIARQLHHKTFALKEPQSC